MNAPSRIAPLGLLPPGTRGRIVAEAVAATLAVLLVVRLGEHVEAPFLLAVAGGLVVSVALARLILAVLLVLASPIARPGPGTVRRPRMDFLPRPCR